MKDRFEQHIKDSLAGFEAEYNPADWSDLQNRLNKANAGKSSGIGKGLLIAASVVVASGTIYYFTTTENKNTTANNVAVKTENVVAENASGNTDVPAKPAEEGKKDQEPVSVKAENSNPAPEQPDTETKQISSEKTVQQVAANTAENKSPVQEQVQNPVTQQPSAPATALSAAFRTDISKICAGTSVQFIADKNESCTYKWFFGDGQSSVEQNPTHIFTEAGTYAVKLRVLSVKDKKQAEQKNTIVVIAAPSVQINHDISEENHLQVRFEGDADKANEWKWDFGDRQFSSMQNPTHTYTKKGNYKVSLTAKNAAGCTSVTVKDIVLKNEIDLLAPNAFSPDGNGVNDTWMPVALLSGDYIFSLTITDIAGNVVFKTSDKNRAWDGQNAKTGDTFIWRAVVKDKNGEDSNYQGLITISE